jgi:hypothetical protein
MMQRFTQWVLQKPLQELSKAALDVQAVLSRIEGVLDTSVEKFTFGTTVQASKDLPFTPEEKQWLKEQGETTILPNILDKLLMNVIVGLAKNPHPATQDDALRVQNIRLAFLLLQSECLEAAGKKTQVDPLTTEVVQK